MSATDALTITSQPATRERLAHTPRLSITHLLFITAVTAAVVSYPLEREIGQSPPPFAEVCSATFFRFLYAAQLAGMFLIAWHAARRTLWRLEPGEWLLLAMATSTIPWLLPGLLQSMRIEPSELNPALSLVQNGTSVAWLASVAIAARRYPWCCLLLVVDALWLVFYTVDYQFTIVDIGDRSLLLMSAIYLLEVVLLTLQVIRDYRGAARRHWLHWLGVMAFGLLNVGTIVVHLIRHLEYLE